jgi:methionine sulfoxide reductase heme-binding subunit
LSTTLLWYTTRGAGAVSLLLLSAVVVLGILSVLRVQSTGWPRFLTVGLHRNLALMTLLFLALHIVTAVVDPFTHLGWLTAVVPFSSYYRTFWLGLGTIAFELLLAIVLTSLIRGFIGQVAWRLVHWLTYASWPFAVLHGVGTGTDAWSAWLFTIQAICVVAVLGAVGFRLMAGNRDPLSSARSSFQAAVDRREPK